MPLVCGFALILFGKRFSRVFISSVVHVLLLRANKLSQKLSTC